MVNNFALVALYCNRLQDAVEALEGLIRRDPIKNTEPTVLVCVPVTYLCVLDGELSKTFHRLKKIPPVQICNISHLIKRNGNLPGQPQGSVRAGLDQAHAEAAAAADHREHVRRGWTGAGMRMDGSIDATTDDWHWRAANRVLNGD